VSILETQSIVKQYKKRRVVDGISLKVETGKVVGLLGPNGAGKTTTFYSIAGFVRPDSGQVYLDGENLTPLPIHKRAYKGLSYLAQDSSVFKKLTVWENVQIVLETLGLPKREVSDRILRRSVRGMLPWKSIRGKEAYARVRAYTGIPEEFTGKKFVELPKGVEKEVKRFVELGEICKLFGAKW